MPLCVQLVVEVAVLDVQHQELHLMTIAWLGLVRARQVPTTARHSRSFLILFSSLVWVDKA